MSDREKELRKEIDNILGYDSRDMLEDMLKGLERGMIMIPKISDQQRRKFVEVMRRYATEKSPAPAKEEYSKMRGGTITFKAKDINFETLKEMGVFPSETFDNDDQSGGFLSEELGDGEIREERDERQEKKRQEYRIDQYENEVEQCQEIFEQRNAVYKDAFVFLGLQGTVATLCGDVIRLRNMILQTPDHGKSHYEQIEDKLRDVVNQAIISLMMLHEDNFTGE